MESNGTLKVLLMGLYKSLCVLIDSNASVWVFIGRYESEWILEGLYSS